MPLSLVRTIEPTDEPVTLAEAKLHCRVDHSADDALITALIVAAREYIELYCRRSLITQTWALSLDDWPYCDIIRLPRPRLISVTSIQYYDSNGTQQTFDASSYYVDTVPEPARIALKGPVVWPVLEDDRPNPITITYQSGYGSAAVVPQAIKQALLLLVGHWYENRETTIVAASIASVPMAVDSLLSIYRTELI